jgi:hypothetical protein
MGGLPFSTTISPLGLAAPKLTISGGCSKRHIRSDHRQLQGHQSGRSPEAFKPRNLATPHRIRAVSVASSLRFLRHFQCVIYLDAQIPHGALDFGMTK